MNCQRCQEPMKGNVPPNKKYCDSCREAVLKELQEAHKLKMRALRKLMRLNQKPLNKVCQYCHKPIDGTKQKIYPHTKYHAGLCANAAQLKKSHRRQAEQRRRRAKIVKNSDPSPEEIEAFKKQGKYKVS